MKPSALLLFNPELQRNLWLEFSIGRIVAMPIVIVLLTAIAYEINGDHSIYAMLNTILWLLLNLWGTRLAVETIGEEVAARTWDVQRLSAQRAVPLVLGKFIGGTSYVWYGAAFCVAGIMNFTPGRKQELLDTLELGLLAQAMAMLMSLVLTRFGNGANDRKRLGNFGAQLIGIIFALLFSLGIFPSSISKSFSQDTTADWFGHSIQIVDFFRLVGAMMIVWLFVGMVRLVRRDLGFRDGPFGWLLFVIYTAILVAGFHSEISFPFTPADKDAPTALRAFAAVHSLTYFALLGLPVSVAASRKLILALQRRAWLGIWRTLPSWSVSLVLAVILAILVGFSGLNALFGALAALGFLLRDIIVVYGFRTRFIRKSESALILYFFLIYMFTTFLIRAAWWDIAHQQPGEAILPQQILMACFAPFSKDTITTLAFIPWVEAILAYLIFRKDFQLIYQPVEKQDEASSGQLMA